MTDSLTPSGPHFTAALNFVNRAQFDEAVTLLTAHPPETPFEEWLLHLALRSREGGQEHPLPADPPAALVLMLAAGYHAHGHAAPIRQATEATTDLHARLGFLKYALLPDSDARADVSLLSVLLETQFQLGDQAGAEETLAHPNLRVKPEDADFIRAVAAVQAARHGSAVSLKDLISQVQTLPTQKANRTRELVLRLTLAAVTAREHHDDTVSLLRDALIPLDRPDHFTTLERDFIETTNAAGTQSWGVKLPGTAEALTFLDTVIAEERFPDDVRGMALMLRCTGDPNRTTLPTEGELEQARAWLGNTLWVRSFMQFEHPLAYIRHKRAWAMDVVDAYGTDTYVDWVDLPELPEGVTLSREETLELHALLTQWPEAFEEGDALEYKQQLRAAAWSLVWQDALKTHGLHREVVQAAQTILEDGWGVGQAEQSAGLFTIAHHASQVGTPTMLDLAAETYEQYLDIYGHSHAALNNLGSVRERQGQFQRADALYRQALTLNPSSEMTQRNLRRIQRPAPLEALHTGGIRLAFGNETSDMDREVALAYWARTPTGWADTLKALSGRYGLTNVALKATAVGSGRAYAVHHTCVDCEQVLVLSSRQELDDMNSRRRTWVCGICTEKRERTRKAHEAQLHQRQVETVRQRFDLTDTPEVTEDLFGFEDAIFLVTLARHAASEDLRVIASLAEMPPGLAPTPDLAVDMLRRLHERKLLRVHPASVPDAFTWEDDEITAFTWTKVRWGVPMGGQQLPFGSLVNALEARLRAGPDTWSANWAADAHALGCRTVLEEALQYLRHVMAEYRLDFSPGEKTHLVLRTVLEDFSLAQTWSILWTCAKNAAAYYQKGGVVKAQAANSVVGRIQSYAERAQAQGWSVRASRRNYDTPMPVLSEVLFTTALGLGPRYQELRPAEWLAAASDTALEGSS